MQGHGNPDELRQKRARAEADKITLEATEADRTREAGAPRSLLLALQAHDGRAISLPVAGKAVSVVLDPASDLDPAEVWELIQSLVAS